jgi:hypothetical protein
VSIRGVCVATAGEVLWGKVVDREMGDMGVSVGGEMGVECVMTTGDCVHQGLCDRL